MNQSPIRLGPLALLLTVISICLTILAILTFTTARADLRLAEKYAETVRARYALEREGQTYLAGLGSGSGTAPGPDDDGVRHVDLDHGEVTLHIGLLDDGQGEERIVSWRQEKMWEQEEMFDNLWDGIFGKEG